ncbi:MAG TPA: hypothetical protein VKV57_01645 [bacterium]|nr:hypothetical protein [bacterium]
MKKMLVMLVLGASAALPGSAFAATADDNHSDSNAWQAPQMAAQFEPAGLGTVAGPGQTSPTFGPYDQQRLDNFGQ